MTDKEIEQRNNAHRLNNALLTFVNWNPEKLNVIADLLNYYDIEQLEADVNSLYEYVFKLEEENKEEV